MANSYINVYKNNPTAGGTDGTAVSLNGEYIDPITVSLDVTNNESKKVKLAIRCEPGYVTTGDTVIADSGDTNDRWKLCLTENGTYTNSITIPATIGATNTIFWARASCADTENPSTDRSVSFSVTATVVQS